VANNVTEEDPVFTPAQREDSGGGAEGKDVKERSRSGV